MVLPINNAYAYGLNESDISNVKPTDYSSCTSYMEAAFMCMQECETNWNTFNQRLAMNELAYLEENGVEIVYEEEAKQGLVQKGVALIQSWLSKVLGVLRKFASEISAKAAELTRWIGISKKRLEGKSIVWPEGAKVEDFNYLNGYKEMGTLGFIRFYKGFADNGSAADKVGENSSKETANWGGTTVKEIKDKLIGTEKVTYSKANVPSASDVFENINGIKGVVKVVNAMAADAKKTANDLIKELKAMTPSQKDRKDNEEKNNEAKAIHASIAAVNKANALNTTLLTAKLNVLTGYVALNRKFAGVYLKADSKANKDANKAEKDAKKAADKAEKDKKKAKNEGGQLADVLGFELV